MIRVIITNLRMPNVACDTPVYQSRTLGTHYMIHKLRALGALIPLCEISIFA